ncbi:MAG: glycosyltransferase family 39 protein [bacterium]|nr:glycosyltransferase family 39 protein [bacterium]
MNWMKNPWVIFLTALAVRLIYISFLKEGYYFSDFRVYERSALSLIAGHGFEPNYARPPLYPLFLSINYLIFGSHFFELRLVQALLAAFSSVLILQIADRIVGSTAARIAAWVSVFYPYYIFLSGLLYPTLLASFFLISTVYLLLISNRQKSLAYLGLASFCLGMAALAVPMSLSFFPFIIIWYLLFSEWDIKRRIIAALVVIVVVFGTLVPWTYYCYQRTGHLVLVDSRLSDHLFIASPDVQAERGSDTTTTSRMNGMMNHPGSYVMTFTGEFFHFFSFVPDRVVTRNPEYRERIHKEDPRLVVDHVFISPLMNWVSILSYSPVFLFALAGIVLGRSNWRLLFFPITLVLSQAMGYSIFFSQVRYRLPVEFCLMILAGGGAVAIWEKYRKKIVN